MTEMCMVGIDIDCGLPVQQIIDRVAKLDLFAVVYTTHSHLKTTSEISKDRFLAFVRKHHLPDEPNKESLSRYLRDEKHYIEEIAASAESATLIEGTTNLLVQHAPMPRCRIILPLSRPYVFADQRKDLDGTPRKLFQPEAQARWKAKYSAVADKLGFPIDKSCLDMARLFYLPRHPADAKEWSIHIIGGAPLDLDAIAEKDADSCGEAKSGDHGDSFILPSGRNLKTWAAKHAKTFQLTRVFEESCPERVRGDRASGKYTVECPYDHEHSNPGDANDAGCYVQDANAEDHDGGFVWSCSHNSCKSDGRDRLDRIKEAIRAEWFLEDVLDNPAFHDEIIEDGAEPTDGKKKAAEKVVAELMARVAAWPNDVGVPDIEALANDAAGAKLDKLREDELVAVVAKKVKERIRKTTIQEMFSKLAMKSRAAQRSEELRKHAGNAVILTLIDDGFRKCIEDAWKVLREQNAAAPRLFNFGGVVMRMAPDYLTGAQCTEPLNQAKLKNELHKHIIWNNPIIETDTAAPNEIAADMLAEANNGLPVLWGIKRTPFFIERDGKITRVDRPGYDATSGYYLDPSPDLRISSVAEAPSDAEMREAKELLLGEVFHDFPFDDETGGDASRAHAMALTLLPFMREIIHGPTPIHLITKPMAGTGAGLLINCILKISTGVGGQAQSEPRDDDERRKQITAALLYGASYIWYDNLCRKLDSAALCTATTEEVWMDRVLGVSKIATIPIRCVWIAAGNNPSTSSEIARRCVPIRLATDGDPLKRKEFKHSHLEDWVREQRGELVTACLTLIQFWVSKGAPRYDGVSLPRFENWSAIMGGLLKAIGMERFLGNLGVVKEDADEEAAAWSVFVAAWYKENGLGLWRPIGSHKGSDNKYKDSLLSIVENNSIDLGITGFDDSAKAKSFGGRLRTKKDNVFAIETADGIHNVRIRIRHSRTNANEYCLESADPIAPAQSAAAAGNVVRFLKPVAGGSLTYKDVHRRLGQLSASVVFEGGVPVP